MTTALRRTMFLVVLAVLGGAAWSRWTNRNASIAPAAAPQWPPLTPVAQTLAPDAVKWVPPNDDGTCPDGYPIKVNASSGIYHVPGGRFHERTRPDRCYATAEAAEADGYRPSKT